MAASAREIMQSIGIYTWWDLSQRLCTGSEETQWAGVRMLYLRLAQGPSSIADFAAQPDCRECVDQMVRLLKRTPSYNPVELFTSDVAQSRAMHIGRPPLNLLQSVMQAQMTGLLLSILLQLALADSYCLSRYIHGVQGLQLLQDMAMGQTDHVHPESHAADDIKRLRPDVHAKLLHVYRLIPLAISCVYEATLSHNTYLRQIDLSIATARDLGQKQLAFLLRRALTLLGLSQDVANSPDGLVFSMRRMVVFIKSGLMDDEAPAEIWQMQTAWQSAFGQYDAGQSGNCLYWLSEEPVSQPQRSSLRSWITRAFRRQQQSGVSQAGHPTAAAAVGGHTPSAPPPNDVSMQAGNAVANHTHTMPSIVACCCCVSHAEANRVGKSKGSAPVRKRWPRVLLATTAFATGVLIGLYPYSRRVAVAFAQGLKDYMRALHLVVDIWIVESKQMLKEWRGASGVRAVDAVGDHGRFLQVVCTQWELLMILIFQTPLSSKP